MLEINGKYFKDEKGSVIFLRGINLAGISIPLKPDGATHIKEGWPPTDLKNVSWEGRPFPLNESEEHFERLKRWGFNCFRFLTSWEAIEHEGPYQYDEKYLDYLSELVKRAGQHGFHVFINFHQDVWSRVTGGDGHPLWLFDKVGLDYTKFDVADAAINMQFLWDADKNKNKYGMQTWGYNSRLFPVRTMWTLFWAGKDFTPKFKVLDDENGESLSLDKYMQKHFIKSMEKVAIRVKDMPHVFGFNPENEPSAGYIGLPVGTRLLKYDKAQEELNPIPGIAWSPLDTMAAAAGHTREIEELGVSLLKGLAPKRIVKKNPNGINIWKKDAEDFWKSHGIWDDKEGVPKALKENYFQFVEGRVVDFTRDYLVPFHDNVAHILRKYNKNWLIIFENDPEINGAIRYKPWPKEMPESAVNGFHWYDVIQLSLKRFFWPIHIDLVKLRPVFGMKGIQKMYIRQMRPHTILSESINDGNCPVIVGEFGISMDMKKGKVYENWKKNGYKVFKKHDKILDLMYNALDELMINGTLWNYTCYNRNGFGDFWNLEDLSIFSKDQVSPFNRDNFSAGARGIGGFCRPYAIKISGIPQQMNFNRKKGIFYLKYKAINDIAEDTEIYVPKNQFTKGIKVKCNADYKIDLPNQRVYISNTNKELVEITITRSS